jgi:glutamate-1-semialdehyde 2,1-aminomutase
VRLDAPRVFFDRGEGAWLWDVEGRDYVDFLLGQGPAFLGHAPPTVVAAVSNACKKGTVYAAQHPLEVDAAESLLRALAWPDLVRFGSSGTEMVQAAVRLARAATGRRRIIRFEGHYHGWLDNVLVAAAPGAARPASAGQLESALDDSIVVPWNDPDLLAEALDLEDDVCAVLMEPIMLNAGAIPPRADYLARVRELCESHGALLIFDEVISGFRVALGGAAERFGVTPDLAVYGKALASGWPVAALAGFGELMERFGTKEVNHSGTFNGNVMAAAAVVATLETLTSDPPYDRIEETGSSLIQGLRALAAEAAVPLHVQGLPVAFHASFGGAGHEFSDFRGLLTRDAERYARFARRLFDAGLWVAPRGIWYLSAAHGQREVEIALERTSRALEGA